MSEEEIKRSLKDMLGGHDAYESLSYNDKKIVNQEMNEQNQNTTEKKS